MKKLTLFMSLLLLALVGIKANAATQDVYVKCSASDAATIHVYTWGPELYGGWPGSVLNTFAEAVTVQGIGYYKFSIDTGHTIIFNNGNSGTGNQTANIALGAGDQYFTYPVDNNWGSYEGGTPPELTSFTIVGVEALLGHDWDTNAAENDMVEQADGSWKLVKEGVALAANDFYYKVTANHTWGVFEIPSDGNQTLTITEEGTYDVTFTMDAELTTLTAEAVKQEAPIPEYVIEVMSVLGDEALFGGTAWENDLDMTQNGAIWTATIESVALEAGEYEYKARANHEWQNAIGQKYLLPADGNNVLAIEEAGEYKIDFIANTENHTLTAAAEKLADPVISITAVELMGSGNSWAAPLASFVVENASTGYWVANDVEFEANDEFKIRVSYSDQSVKWLVPVTEGNFLVDEAQLGHELTLTTEGGMDNMYVDRNATLSFSLAPGFGTLVITGEFVQPEPAFTLHHGHDGQNDWQSVAMTAEDGIFTAADVEFTEGEVFYFTDENDNYYPNEEAANDLIFVVHSGYCTDIDLYGAGCHFFQMNEASTFTIVLDASEATVAPTFDVTGWPSHDLEMYLYGNIEGGGWENGTLMDVLEANSHWLTYFTVEDVNNGNGYLKLGKAATFSDDTAIGAVEDADNYEVIAESAAALRALQIPMVDGGKAIEIAAGRYAMHVWYNAETGEGRVQFDPQNVPIGKVEILVPDDGLVIEQGQTLQLEAVYTPQYTTNADLSINWLSSDPSIATVDENGLVTALVPEANGAPRRAPSKNADNTVTITASMTNNDGSVIDGTIDITVSEPTGINDLVVDANVASVKYINAMGQMSDRAFDGLNIMVTTYIDGTTSTVKVVK